MQFRYLTSNDVNFLILFYIIEEAVIFQYRCSWDFGAAPVGRHWHTSVGTNRHGTDTCNVNENKKLFGTKKQKKFIKVVKIKKNIFKYTFFINKNSINQYSYQPCTGHVAVGAKIARTTVFIKKRIQCSKNSSADIISVYLL